MNKEMEIKLEGLKIKLNDFRAMIIGINNEIEKNGLQPTASQQGTIDYICQQGRETFEEIIRLEKNKER